MEPEKKVENKIVETYAEDMAKAIESGQGGMVKKIIRGEEIREIEKKNLSPESKKNKLFMFIGIALVCLAVLILSFFLFFRKTINTVAVPPQFTPMIFNEKTSLIEVAGFARDEIGQAVLNEVNGTEVKQGGLEGIYLTENKQMIGLRRFISLIKSNFVPGDNLVFVQDNFLMGVVNNGVDASGRADNGFFILLKVRSSADIFGAMRSWEGKMFSDLHTFLGVEINKDTNYLFTKDFDDGIIENKNARILHDKDGNIALIYVFADDNSVIITDSQAAAHEVMLRLSSGLKKQ